MQQPTSVTEISKPLAVVDELFAKHIAVGGQAQQPAWGEKQHFQQALGLQNEATLNRIPCLNDVALRDEIAPFTLVRYRCLIQDIFDPEMYIALFEERQANSTERKRWVTTKYRDWVDPAPGHEFVDSGCLPQRGVCYGVPLPGETAWAKTAAVEWSQAGGSRGATATGSGARAAVKRSRPDEDVDMDDASSAPAAEASDAFKKWRPGPDEKLASLGVCPRVAPSAEAFGLNFPIPSEEEPNSGAATPCIIKLYDEDMDAVRVGESAEFIGVLCINPEAARFEPDPWDAENACDPSTALVPRLHVLHIRKLPFYNPIFPYSSSCLTEAFLGKEWQAKFASPGFPSQLREAAVHELAATCFAGDLLAGEYTLDLLASRVFARLGSEALGAWCLNIACGSHPIDGRAVCRGIAEFAPRVVYHEVTSETLNEQRWRPKKDFAANRLLAGRLQLASGSVAVIDETKMVEGTLNAHGVKSLDALQTLIMQQQLDLDYEVASNGYVVHMPSEVQALVLSGRKSIMRDLDVVLPLVPSTQGRARCADKACFEAVRFLLAVVTRTADAVVVPDEVASQFSNDFAQVRQQTNMRAEIAHTWLSLARASCLTHGEKELTLPRWQRVLEMEKERLQRCAAQRLEP
mmetsp:Transcript_48995/g.116547  ORF Transcript_48995/g.116547 Transcript_48995/m.116547 type:complete len:634 (-) Transcript_48995:116-2017(-)|eukprot:CAMPEP_0178405596 /NCGR_PEP_ID=MMETSP0689_2-20121128/18481_1 /TAXON_ID=160604 /ORGANISM="Amphidinium massartii, Strain CS-259" /LENGTH=633 /DNA_ID=CAMNT_0020026617 /DNA_START=80 /DNA_END=1981 /DNA_ORIENTATION=-